MRRSASLVIRNLEMRIARLEKQSGYMYRGDSSFPNSVRTHIENLLFEKSSYYERNNMTPSDLNVSIRGLKRHHEEGDWCLEFNYGSGSNQNRGGLFLFGSARSEYRDGRGNPSKREVIEEALSEDKGSLTFDYY